MDSLQEALSKERAEHDQTMSRLAQAEEAAAALQQQNEELSRNLAQVTAHADRQAGALRTLREAADALRVEQEQTERKRSADLAALRRTFDQYKVDAESRDQAALAELNSVRQKNWELIEKHRKAQERAEALATELEIHKRSVENLTHELTILKDVAANLRQEAAAKTLSLAQMQERTAALTEKLELFDSVSAGWEETKSKLEELRKEQASAIAAAKNTALKEAQTHIDLLHQVGSQRVQKLSPSPSP